MNNVERTLSIRYLDVESLRKTFFKDVSISFGKIVLMISVCFINIFVTEMIPVLLNTRKFRVKIDNVD